MKLEGIVWDVDGTLCDTLPLCLAAFRDVFARHVGRILGDDEIMARFGATEAGTIRELVVDGWRRAHDDYLEFYAARHPDMATVFPGVIAVLEACRRRGLRQAVVTGKGPETARTTLEAFGLLHYFEPVETGSDQGPVKPDRIRRVLRAWGLSPGTVAYLGDTAYDVEAATEAGVVPLRASWSPTAHRMGDDDVRRPAAEFARPSDLLDWLDAAR